MTDKQLIEFAGEFRDGIKAVSLDRKRDIAKAALEVSIRQAYAMLGLEEATGLVTWAHNAIHTEYVRK
jgi:hypothetical protein